MKNCSTFEKKLTAYLHGELGVTESEKLSQHLETCTRCRNALAAQRTTLELLDEALEAAPAPERLVAWRQDAKRVSAHRMTLADYWFSPQFRAGLVTAGAFSIFIFISLSFVTVRVVQKKDVAFTPAEAAEYNVAIADGSASAARPAMKLKRPIAPSAPSPKPSQRIVTKVKRANMPDVQLPETAAAGEGLAGGTGGFEIRPDIQSMSYMGRAAQWAEPEFNTEQYDRIVDNAFKTAMDNPLSTFSIDVDRAAYANVRRFLTGNQLPPPDAVRIEEMVNYFDYDYPKPKGDDPFVVSMEVADCPWNSDHQLALIGLQGLEIETENLPPNNLVFLLDVSGSMNQSDKLPLLKAAMRLLVEQLRPEDRVSIVVYAGAAGLVLEPTNNKADILEAINRLNAGGSTAGGAGIELAYKIAKQEFIKDGNNRVILATDGDFNVGVSSDGALTRLIEEKRRSGVFLTVLGFGTGNYKDSKMEKLADKGNGNYAYIDDILEARKVLVNEMGGTLVTIAKDVKIQVEFNPQQVKAYRLIGYENRMLAKEDFANDTKDAGELGAGHSVTALYELIPAGSEETVSTSGELKYQKTKVIDSDELMTVKLRYKQPDGEVSKLLTESVRRADTQRREVSENLEFASAVAEFGLLLRNSEYKGAANFDDVLRRAKEAKGSDEEGYRAEFIRMVERARLLDKGSK